MAQVATVTVDGEPFAVCTTTANAWMLAEKVAKRFAVSTDVDDILLFNPKHASAEDALLERGFRRRE